MPAETAREGYRWSSITSDDVEAWAQLTNHLAVVDGTEEFYDAEDRLEELKDPATDPTLDALAVWSGEQMVGFGTVAVRPNPDREGRARVGVDGGVHPDHRRRGIGAGVMERMEARGRELAQRQHPHRAFHFDTGGGLEDSSARSFHFSRGYQVARHYHLRIPCAAIVSLSLSLLALNKAKSVGRTKKYTGCISAVILAILITAV